MWSTTARGFSEFIGDLHHKGIYSSSVRALEKTFKDKGIYPARDFANRCKLAHPDVFFTFYSEENFVDIQEIVWRTFDFVAQLLKTRRPDLQEVDLEPMIADEIRLWVYFMFIDQNARDIRQELDILPLLLDGCRAHFVLGELPLTRTWCCYEIALFNQRCATQDEQLLRSFIAPSQNIYFGWEQAETSEAEDKLFIQDRISKNFPNGFDGFNRVMNQANGTAVLSLTERSPFYTPAAIDALGEAAEYWYSRMSSK